MTSHASVGSFAVLLMSSKADLAHSRAITDALTGFGIPSEVRIASAHKTPAALLKLLTDYETDPRPKVYITISGRSNALSGLVDAQVAAPVIACPPPSEAFGGADIYSSIRMPGGVAPMLVIDPGGAALAAAKILALDNPDIHLRVVANQKANSDKILADDAELNPTVPHNFDL